MTVPTGDGPTGDGPTGDGPTGDGPTGDGPTGDGPTGDGPTCNGPTGNGPNGHGVADHRLSAAELAATPPRHRELARGALLRADDLVAGYLPGVNILQECNFFLREREIVGIIGPNGAGKSTLLKAMFGLIPVRCGSVTLRDTDVTSAQAHTLVTKGVGYVPQSNNVFGSLSIEENMQMGVYLRPRTFTARFDAVCTLFPLLRERRKTKAGALSGGERQMVAMGRALMMEPSVLLLDEPSAGLSPMFADEVFVRCKKINATGVSIVMVEQNARRCLQVCDRGYVLDQGRNTYTDTGAALMNDPKVIELYLGSLASSRKVSNG
ncbi:MAG: ABC transporter ATP-binding protein [Pseudonocardiaceae bacterium]